CPSRATCTCPCCWTPTGTSCPSPVPPCRLIPRNLFLHCVIAGPCWARILHHCGAKRPSTHCCGARFRTLTVQGCPRACTLARGSIQLRGTYLNSRRARQGPE